MLNPCPEHILSSVKYLCQSLNSKQTKVRKVSLRKILVQSIFPILLSDTISRVSSCLSKKLWFVCWSVVFTSCSFNNILHIWRHHHYGKGLHAPNLRPLSTTCATQVFHLKECPNLGTFYGKQRVLRIYSYPNSHRKMNYEMNQYISRACTSKQVELMKTKFLKMKTRHNFSQMKTFTMIISWLEDDRLVTWTSFCDRSVTWTPSCDAFSL